MDSVNLESDTSGGSGDRLDSLYNPSCKDKPDGGKIRLRAKDKIHCSSSSNASKKGVPKRNLKPLKVPVFIDGDDEIHPQSWSWETISDSQRSKDRMTDDLLNKSMKDILDSFYTCPICREPMIEATATNCGHTFCSSCLKDWTKLKPICPLCSKEVTCRTRLFNEDQAIERVLRDFDTGPSNYPLNKKLQDVSQARMKKTEMESKNKGFVNKIRQYLDELLISCKCKGIAGAFKNSKIYSSSRRFYQSRQTQSLETVPTEKWSLMEQRGFVLFCGIIIGASISITTLNLSSSSNFFYYMYLSMKKYNGKIPFYLLEQTALNGTGAQLIKDGGSSYFESFCKFLFWK